MTLTWVIPFTRRRLFLKKEKSQDKVLDLEMIVYSKRSEFEMVKCWNFSFNRWSVKISYDFSKGQSTDELLYRIYEKYGENIEKI